MWDRSSLAATDQFILIGWPTFGIGGLLSLLSLLLSQSQLIVGMALVMYGFATFLVWAMVILLMMREQRKHMRLVRVSGSD